MSFLTDAEATSLRLARMSLHLVSNSEFVPEPEIAVEQDDFLLDRIRDVAFASVYRFDEVSKTRDLVERIGRRDVGFQEGAQELAREFCRFHRGGMSEGAFFVFELGVADELTKVYALMKYDYGNALEVVDREGHAGLRRIVKAFVEDKSAIQKSALIRVVDGTAEAAISTRDRVGRPAPDLTEYFIGFLQVSRERSDAELTTAGKEVIRTVIEDHSELLPAGGVAPAVSRALEVLRSAEVINEDVLRQAVWVGVGQPSDEKIRETLSASVGRLVKRRKLTGIVFQPDRRQLGRPIMRVVKTQEGVIIQYNTGLEGEAVRKIEGADGSTQFIITTKKYTDHVAADNPRRSG